MDALLLQSFLTIVECGSITAASDRLSIAQPSLSQQLLRLEDELGVRLFTRTARGVSITEEGLVFEEHARNILDGIRRAREDVRGISEVMSGHVSVGLPLSVSVLLGVPLVLAVQRELPNVRLTLKEAQSGGIRQWVEEGRLDLAVLYDAKSLRHLSVRPLVVERFCLVGPPGEFPPLESSGGLEPHIALEDISPQRLILPSRQRMPQFVEGIRMEVDSIVHIKALITAGLGYSILSDAAVFEDLAAGRLSAIRLRGSAFQRDVDLARNPTQIVRQASIGVEGLLLSLMRSMTERGVWAPAAEDAVDSPHRPSAA